MVIILIIGLTCRVAFSLLTPTFYAPDEQSHFNYVKYLAESRSFPVQTSKTDASTNDWEYYQPPIYYLVLTPFYLMSERLFQNDFITVRLLRAFSIFLWGITVLLTFKFLDSLKVYDAFLRIFVTAMICLLPTYTFLSSVINNDNLLITIGTAILYLVTQPLSRRNSMFTGFLLGLALLTKLTAIVYITLIILMLFIILVKRAINRDVILHRFLLIGLALALWAPWGWRNYRVYGSITAEEVANVPRQWVSVYQAVIKTLQYMGESFWSVSGIYNNVYFIYPKIGILVFLFACAGLIYGLFFSKKQLHLLIQGNHNIIIALMLAIGINVVLVIRFGVLYGQGQGRFLFPLLIPISLLMGMGFRMYSLSNRYNILIHLTGFFVTYVMSFTLYSLAMFLII